MKLYEVATAILVGAAVYWIVASWFSNDCTYTVPVDSMQVTVIDECGLAMQEVINNFKVGK